MLLTIFLLSGLFLIKNIIFLNLFNYNYLIFAIDLIGLSFGSVIYSWSYIFEWLLLGWVGLSDEIQFLNNDIFQFNPWAPSISWLIIFSIINIFYIIKYLIKNKQLKNSGVVIIQTNLKLMIINYLPISLWNLHRIIDINSDSFWPLFSNLMFFNTMAFGLLSVMFYFIYGENLFYYREKFYFLISDFHPQYKGFYIITFIFKLLLVSFIFFHHFFLKSHYYFIISILFIYLILVTWIKPYKIYIHNINLIISLTIALVVVIIAQLENYYQLESLFILKCICLILFVIIMLISKCSYKIKNTNESSEFLIVK